MGETGADIEIGCEPMNDDTLSAFAVMPAIIAIVATIAVLWMAVFEPWMPDWMI